jgi:hypothetical protein
MTNTRAFESGFDFVRPKSRRERIARLNALATVLDTAFLIPGIKVRFGVDSLIGLVPGIGDAVTTAMSLWLIHEAHQIGAPGPVIGRMLRNVVLDGLIGAVPIVGDVFDVMWRANRRNMRIPQDWLERLADRDELQAWVCGLPSVSCGRRFRSSLRTG